MKLNTSTDHTWTITGHGDQALQRLLEGGVLKLKLGFLEATIRGRYLFEGRFPIEERNMVYATKKVRMAL